MNNDYFDNVNQNDLDDLIKDMKQFHTNTKNTVNPDNQKLFNKLANEINDYLKEIDRVDVNGEIKFFNTEVSGSYKTM